MQPQLLIIDEIGYLPLDRLGANLFFQLVSRRYERGSILITSNQSLAGWGQVFGDPVIATAILDRLLHHSTTVNIKGESYRLKEKRKAGLLTRSEPYTAAGSPAARNRPHLKRTNGLWILTELWKTPEAAFPTAPWKSPPGFPQAPQARTTTIPDPSRGGNISCALGGKFG